MIQLCSESKDNIEMTKERFVETLKKSGLNVNAGNSGMMRLGGEQRYVYEIILIWEWRFVKQDFEFN